MIQNEKPREKMCEKNFKQQDFKIPFYDLKAKCLMETRAAAALAKFSNGDKGIFTR